MNPYKLEKAAKFFIYFVLFLPIIIAPFTMWPTVFVKNLLFYLLAAVILLVALIYLYKDRYNTRISHSPLIWLFFIFLIIRIISGIFGADSRNSFFGFEVRMGGNIGFIAIAGYIMALLLFFRNKDEWHKIIKLMLIAAFIVSCLSLLQGVLPTGNILLIGQEKINLLQNRLSGILGNPIFLAGYILPHIFLSLYIFFEEKKKNKRIKYLYLYLSAFFAVIVILTQTKGALLSLGITSFIFLIFFAFFLLKNKFKVNKSWFLYALPLLAAGLYIVWNSNAFNRLANELSLASTTVATRFLIWKITFASFLDKWFLGWGPENFTYGFSKFYNPELLKYSFYETWADKPHNQFLEVLATTGILGFLSYALLLGGIFWAVIRLARGNKKYAPSYILLGLALLSYCLHVFFAFDTLESRLVIFVIMAFVIFLSTADSGAENKKISRGLVRNIFIILFIALAVSLKLIGIKTIYAARYASGAVDAVLNNQYFTGVEYFKKLSGADNPYQNNNWEYLADIVLKSDAKGALPVTASKEIVPILVKGLEQAVKDRPDNFSYNYRLAQMYNLAGLYIDGKYADKAIESLGKSKAISPKRQVSDLLLAEIYYDKREPDKGIALLEKMIKDSPDVIEPYWFVGILYDAKGDYDKSYAYMTTAADHGRMPKNFNEDVLYVTVLGRKNDYKRMASAYRWIIEQDTTNARWWANLAVVYLELHEYDNARDAARQAIFLDPKFGDEGEAFLKKVDKAEEQ